MSVIIDCPDRGDLPGYRRIDLLADTRTTGQQQASDRKGNPLSYAFHGLAEMATVAKQNFVRPIYPSEAKLGFHCQ